MDMLSKDRNGIRVQAFVFRAAMMSGTTLTPAEDMLVHISTDVDITLDGIAVAFSAGDKIALVANNTYTFGESIALGLA